MSRPVRDAIKKEKLQKEYKRHVWNRPSKARAQQKASAEENRYKVVSHHRAPNLEDLDIADEKGKDASEKEATKNKEESNKDENKENVAESEAVVKKLYCLYDVVQEERDGEKASEQVFVSLLQHFSLSFNNLIDYKAHNSENMVRFKLGNE